MAAITVSGLWSLLPGNTGAVFYGGALPAGVILRALVALCEGVSPRKVARIFEVDKDTVWA